MKPPIRNRVFEKGITLLEILAVLVIIALVFIALSRNLGFGSEKAKLTDVQQASKPFRIAFENSMNEYSGVPLNNSNEPDMTTLNRYLGNDYKIQNPVDGSGTQTSKLKDPWNTPYKVQAKVVSDKESIMIFRSSGADKNSTSTDLFTDTKATTDKDDILFVTHYKDGAVKSCTLGFEKNAGTLGISTDAGLTAVQHDVSQSMRQPFLNTYAYEYAVDFMLNTSGGYGSYRTYVYANQPLQLSIQSEERVNSDDTPYTVERIKEATNQPYVGFAFWEVADIYRFFQSDNTTHIQTENVGFATPQSFSTPNILEMVVDNPLGDGLGDIGNIYEVPRTTVPPNTVIGCF